jgi:hypothetical protein
MEFKRFVANLIRLPCRIVQTGRRLVHRMPNDAQRKETAMAGRCDSALTPAAMRMHGRFAG